MDNLIKIGNKVNSLGEFDDNAVNHSSFNFLTDLDYYADFIKYDNFLGTTIFAGQEVNLKNIERAKNFVNIYYHFLSQKINYNDEKPSNYEELSLEERIKFLSEIHDKMMGLLLELDKESIPDFVNDLNKAQEEYNAKFPSQNTNSSKQSQNNKDQTPITSQNKRKMFEEVPFEIVDGSKNRNKRLELLISGTKLPRNNKYDDNLPLRP